MKQRLIGAAVLVALAVIFLPMLLGRPEPAAPPRADVPVDIPPAPDRPLQTREIPLTLPPAEAPDADPDAVVTVDADTVQRADALADVTAPTPEDGDSQVAPAEPVVPAPAVEPAPTPAASQSAPAPVARQPAPAPPAATDGRFAVNLGSYRNKDNADALAARLSLAGLAVISEPIDLDGKPATRIRIGPYATRGEAESGRLAVRKLQADVPTAVIDLGPDSGTTATPRSTVSSGFSVQLGALRDEAEANALRDRLRRAGFAGYTERTRTDNGMLWRVRAGPELDRARAEQLRADLRSKLKLDGIVVGHP